MGTDFNQQITWLDYILLNNPDGILKVLSSYGYTGHNAPVGYDEIRDASLDVMDQHGERGIISILRAHPEYGAFKDLFGRSHSPFFNTVDDPNGPMSLFNRMRNGLKPFDDLFIALSVFSLAYFIIEGVIKK